eukprot:IDg21320t1
MSISYRFAPKKGCYNCDCKLLPVLSYYFGTSLSPRPSMATVMSSSEEAMDTPEMPSALIPHPPVTPTGNSSAPSSKGHSANAAATRTQSRITTKLKRFRFIETYDIFLLRAHGEKELLLDDLIMEIDEKDEDARAVKDMQTLNEKRLGSGSDANTPTSAKKRSSRDSSHSDDDLTASILSHTEERRSMDRKRLKFEEEPHFHGAQ